MSHFKATKLAVLAAVCLLGVASSAATASTYTYTTIDVPCAAGQGGTLPFGINNAGEIVGYYGDDWAAQGFR